MSTAKEGNVGSMDTAGIWSGYSLVAAQVVTCGTISGISTILSLLRALPSCVSHTDTIHPQRTIFYISLELFKKTGSFPGVASCI